MSRHRSQGRNRPWDWINRSSEHSPGPSAQNPFADHGSRCAIRDFIETCCAHGISSSNRCWWSRYMEPTRDRRQDSVRAKSYAVQGVSRLSHAISLPAMAVSVTLTYRSAHFLTSRTLRGLKTTAPPDYSAARPNSYRDEIRGLQIANRNQTALTVKGFRYVQRRAVTELALIPAARQWAVYLSTNSQNWLCEICLRQNIKFKSRHEQIC